MFYHLFIYKLKILLRKKTLLFWTFLFPFILGLFFKLALGNIGAAFEFEPINIAVVNNEEYKLDTNLNSIITSLSSDDKNKIFNTKYVNEEEAITLLDDKKVSAYIIIKDKNPELRVKSSGIQETIIKYVLDQYYQTNDTVNNMIKFNPEVVKNGVLNLVAKQNNYVLDDSNEKIDFTLNYFLTLIAMTCLYGGLIGLEVIKDYEANLSPNGARSCVSPIHKIKLLSSGLLAGFVIQIVILILLIAFLIVVFDVNINNHLPKLFLLSSVGCLAGTLLGTFVGVSNKKSEGFKIGLLIAVLMACCFFSGMMGSPQVKTMFDEALPLFSKINPINIITDGLYALFAYDKFDSYYNCLLRIGVFAIVMAILTFIFVRRKNYDSI